MKELELLSQSYDNKNEDIYLKSFYGMAIAKIENLFQEYYNGLDSMPIEYFIDKILNNSNYKDNLIKRVISKLNNMSIKSNEKRHIELLKFSVYLFEEEYEKISTLDFDNLKEVLHGNYTHLPQSVDKLNDISKEFYNVELFKVIEIDKTSNISSLAVTNSEEVDLRKIFHEIYDRRQKCLHLDQLKSIDFDKLEIHRKSIEIVLNKLVNLNNKKES